MKRGEIYYIEISASTGSELRKARPGIIVSNDKQNERSGLLEVVYLTTAPKEERPTHVSIRSADRPSTALCEQINTVSKARVGNYCGTCTEEEMKAIDLALLSSLGIELEPPTVQMSTDVMLNYTQAIAERDVYKELYHKLIDKAVL
jgi:mRNA interferase MazF